MINKSICLLLMCSVFATNYYESPYTGSTLAAVNIAGAIVKATHVETTKKYKRSQCPVCKGKGWYISGDKITEVPCGYCEPDTKNQQKPTIIYNR